MNQNDGKRYIGLPVSSGIFKGKHMPVKLFPSKICMNIFPRLISLRK